MHTFEVWAPGAPTLAVEVDGQRYEMAGPDESGWWRAMVESAGPGSDYGFVVGDDDRGYPDPRSLWQPNGVHALSRVFDQEAFQWSDFKWQPTPLASAIVYEMHVGTFTPEGTFDAAIAKLEYLQNLRVTHIELMPVASCPGHHGWGYDGVALFSVYEPYGGPEALKRFVDAAHNKGVAVLLDVVYNHFGPVGNYTGKFGPYVTDHHHTPWGGAVNLEDAYSREVRRFFIDNALMWMRDFHMDGLRLDAVHAYVDRSAIHFLEQLAIETEMLGNRLGKRLVLVAESDSNDPRIVTSREAGGYGIDAQWSDDFHHALFSVLAKERSGYYSDFGSIEQLAKSLNETFVYDGIYSKHRRRIHGRSSKHLSPHRFFGFIQNHDQVGNRAVGERIQVSAGIDRAKIAAALVLMSPFIPMIFQGEEWAASTPFQYFADHDDAEMARLVSEGRKKEFEAFGWRPDAIPDPEKKETFECSKLEWKELSDSEHAEMLSWYRSLIALRKTEAALNEGEPGKTKATYDENESWLVMQRGNIRVLCNLGDQAHPFPIAGEECMILGSQPDIHLADGVVTVPADAVAILHGA